MKDEQTYSPLDTASSQLVNDEIWLQKVPEQYRQTVEEQSKVNGVPVSTAVKMLLIENEKFDPQAISPTGAMGLSQVLPSTGADLGYSPEQLMDPKMNIAAGLKYLGQQGKKFNGNDDLMLGAYNMGPGHMDQILAGKAEWTPEGSNYIKKAHALGGANPAPVPHGDSEVAMSMGFPNTSDTRTRLNTDNTWGTIERAPFPQTKNIQSEQMVEEDPAPMGLLAMAREITKKNESKRKRLES